MSAGCLAAMALTASVLFRSAAAADPGIDYILHCRGCHGPEGKGVPGSVPSLRGEVARFLMVEGGREYLIRVPGVAQSPLTDARTAELLNWMVREFGPQSAVAGSARFTAEEVARHRKSPLTDAGGARRTLLDAIER